VKIKVSSVLIALALIWSANALGQVVSATPATPDLAGPVQPESEAPTSTTLETLEVTGTRLKRVDSEDTQPLTIISREQIDASGQVSVADLLQELPQNSFGSTNLHAGFDSPTLNLRGVGAQYTLLLINGIPLVAEPRLSGGDQQNVSLIPLAAVDHIEILNDGASAIYGSKAIGGVVNIITRQDFNGGNVTLQHDNPQHGGLNTDYASASYGATTDRGGFLLSTEYMHQDPLLYAQRPFLPLELSNIGNPGSYRPRDPVTGDLTDAGWSPDSRCPAMLGTSPFPNSIAAPYGPYYPFCFYNTGAVRDQAPTFQSKTLMASGHYDISDTVAFHAILLMGENLTHNEGAGDNGIIIQAVPADSPFNELYPGSPLDLAIRTTGLGEKIDDHDDRYGQLTSGLTGSRLFGLDANWTVDLTLSGYLQGFVGQNYARVSALKQAISEGRFNPFGDPQDYSGLNYSPFSDNALHSQDLVAYVQPNGWELGAAPIEALAGIEGGHERYAVNNDLPSTQGDVLGIAADNSAAARDSYAIFAEADVNSGGTFEGKAAWRYDHFSDQGGGSSPKLAALWRFHPDWLLRASIGDGFHVADLESLNQSKSESIVTGIQDTLRCNNEGICIGGPYDQLAVANPYLRPETARQGSIGSVFSPSPNFSASLDYYDVRIQHGIIQLDAQTVVTNEANCAAENRECSLYGEGQVIRDINGLIQTIVITSVNANVIRTSGVNLRANAGHEFDFGTLSFDVNLARVLDYEVALQDLNSGGNQIGFLNQPRYRMAAALGWKHNAWQANLIGHYIAGQTDCNFGDGCGAPPPRLSHYATADIQVSRAFSWRGKAEFGIRNLTDRNPPIDLVENDTYNGNLYDVIGRTFYFRYEQSF
jgi:iron complex outermembrane recepter protein